MANTNGNGQSRHRPGSFWHRCGQFVDFINQKFAYFVGLPIVTVVGAFLASHYQYLSTYDDKVNAIGKEQILAAEATFADVSGQLSKAITLQQLLFFNYHDAIKTHRDGDAQALETKNARAIFKDYDDLRTQLRENVDLMARRVEVTIDWASNKNRDAANAGPFGGDPMSRIALGNYDFNCDADKYMPSFKKPHVDVPPTKAMLKTDPNAPSLGIDWYSTKHQLLTLYYCFQATHGGIEVVRQWASSSAIDEQKKKDFIDDPDKLAGRFDREAQRLHYFNTLAARDIDAIRVIFRPRKWYCHLPVVREYIDHYGHKCTPIRTAQNGAAS
jgi:hypothetical protein